MIGRVCLVGAILAAPVLPLDRPARPGHAARGLIVSTPADPELFARIATGDRAGADDGGQEAAAPPETAPPPELKEHVLWQIRGEGGEAASAPPRQTSPGMPDRGLSL